MRDLAACCLLWILPIILVSTPSLAGPPAETILPPGVSAGKDLSREGESTPQRKNESTKGGPIQEDLQGDPFGGPSGEDPFANEPAFQTGGDDSPALPESTPLPDSGPFQVDVHGYLESRNQVRTSGDGKAISTRQRLWLESDWAFSADTTAGDRAPLRLFASAAVDIDPAADDLSDDHDLFRVHGQEIFATYDSADLDIILGRKMLRWGTGDGINPLDLINPLDFRDPVATGRADSRVPVFLGQAILRLPTFGAMQETTLEGVVIPRAEVNRLNKPGSAWEGAGLKALREAAAQGQLVLAGQEEPDDPLEDAEFGLRLAATFSGWDLALIGFYGFIDAPVFARDVITIADGSDRFRLTPEHPDFFAVGVNFAKGLDRSTVRGELALKPDLPLMRKDATAIPGYVRRAVVEGVVGVDRTFGTNLYTNFQYFGTLVEGAGRLVQDTYDHGLTYEIHDLFWQDDLEAGIRGIVSFSDQGWTCEPYAEYRLGDDWLLAVSMLFFEGSATGRYGQFDDNDILTIRLRYSF